MPVRAPDIDNRSLLPLITRLALCLILASVVLPSAAQARHSHTTAAANGAGWHPIASQTAQPPPRSQYGMAADSAGDVYLFGGSSVDGEALGDFWRLRPATGDWELLQNTVVPPLIEPHLTIDRSGNVYEFGGISRATSGHLSYDGHSFGLYEYVTSAGTWIDLTPETADQGVDWPAGREDHGFSYNADSDSLYLFAGEGPGGVSMNDLWTYSRSSRNWSAVNQHYTAPHGATIDPREIYNISYDYHGGFYLFGGSYLTVARGDAATPQYANDLWHFESGSATWSLLAGIANGYDPTMPLPRHYFGQSCDTAGDFYMLEGYLGGSGTPPFFASDLYARYAHPVTLDGIPTDNLFQYALDDFWQFSPTEHRWFDISDQLGDLARQPAIPYVLVTDSADSSLVTVSGFRVAGSTLLRSTGAWSIGLPPQGGSTWAPLVIGPSPTAAAAISPTASASASPRAVTTHIAVVPPMPTSGDTQTTPTAQPRPTPPPQSSSAATRSGSPPAIATRSVFMPGEVLYRFVPQPDDNTNPPH